MPWLHLKSISTGDFQEAVAARSLGAVSAHWNIPNLLTDVGH
jgi:hypothetical protein